MKNTEPNVGITNLRRKKQLQLFEINKIIMLNFSFIQRVYFLNLFSAIYVYVYHDTPSRNCSCIITLNREKCQIIKSPCWRFQARHKLWNWKRQSRASSHQSSGLSIAAVYTGLCSIIMRYLRGSALVLFLQSYYLSCTASFWNFSSFRGDFLFLQTKDLIRTHH